MSAARNVVALDQATEDRLALQLFATMFASEMRALLDTPMSDPTFRDVVVRCRALLKTYDEDRVGGATGVPA